MSFLSDFLSGGNSSTTPANPAAPDNNVQNPPATPPADTQQQQQQQQQQQTPPADTPPATPPADQQFDLASLFSGGSNDANLTPEQQSQQTAESFINALMNQQDPEPQGTPAINIDKLEFDKLNLGEGVNMQELIDGLNGENGAEVLGKAMQTFQANTIRTLVPLMNELVNQAFQAATNTAVTNSSHNMLSSAIVSEFNQKYEYAGSPVVSQMLPGFANVIAQNANMQRMPPAKIAEGLHRVFQGMGMSMFQQQTPPQGRNADGRFTSPGMDHSDLFTTR